MHRRDIILMMCAAAAIVVTSFVVPYALLSAEPTEPPRECLVYDGDTAGDLVALLLTLEEDSLGAVIEGLTEGILDRMDTETKEGEVAL